jgi:hypothetical protein
MARTRRTGPPTGKPAAVAEAEFERELECSALKQEPRHSFSMRS